SAEHGADHVAEATPAGRGVAAAEDRTEQAADVDPGMVALERAVQRFGALRRRAVAGESADQQRQGLPDGVAGLARIDPELPCDRLDVRGVELLENAAGEIVHRTELLDGVVTLARARGAWPHRA